MDNKIFSGLEQMGFDNVSNLDIYNKKNAEEKREKKDKQKSLLYTRTIKCPVCGNEFKTLAVKSSAYRAVKKDSDFFIRYDLINPYFYDVWLCNSCGYAAMKTDYEKLYSRDIDKILSKITPKWKGREYPEVYDVNIAIERYKLALLNYVMLESPSSKKAMTCLKIAWMYRLIDSDKSLEFQNTFLKQALNGFEDAYYNERFPVYGLDKFATMYLIGELFRRIGNYNDSLVWLSNVITSQGATTKLKDLARDQRDLVKEEIAKTKLQTQKLEQDLTEDIDTNNKGNFFSRIWKKN